MVPYCSLTLNCFEPTPPYPNLSRVLSHPTLIYHVFCPTLPFLITCFVPSYPNLSRILSHPTLHYHVFCPTLPYLIMCFVPPYPALTRFIQQYCVLKSFVVLLPLLAYLFAIFAVIPTCMSQGRKKKNGLNMQCALSVSLAFEQLSLYHTPFSFKCIHVTLRCAVYPTFLCTSIIFASEYF